jgi:predicted amidohydrolase
MHIRVVTITGQFCAKAVLSKNLEAVSGIITDAARAGAKMIFLPEASDFIANNADESASLTKPLPQNEFVQGVRAKAKETGVWVSVGVHETVRALPRIIRPHSHIGHPVTNLCCFTRVLTRNVGLILTC